MIPGTRDLLAVHAANPARYPFLLQSLAGHPVSGRYDILFGFPRASLSLARGTLKGEGMRPASARFFESLSAWQREEPRVERAGLPFCGGWFLFLGYEAARELEPSVSFPESPHGLPDALAVRCPAALIYDREARATHLVAEDAALLPQLEADLLTVPATSATVPEQVAEAVEEDAPESFLGGVRRIHDYLRAGDTFQVNLSRAWRGKLCVDYLDVYRRLRTANPAPFGGLAHWKGAAVLSSSPERLVTVDGTRVHTRPIAGTRPRGADEAEDRNMRARLLESLKERAEHIMLIDLERNDLGRVCTAGSIRVDELMTIESYAHVHHIVSNVSGTLRAGVGAGEVLAAVFPGGTITGCPKVRAMQIIAELEGVGRGPYTGSFGYLSLDGRLDTNILIRSLVCENRRVTLRAGAGIVADSDPEAELAETRAKARGLLRALGAAA